MDGGVSANPKSEEADDAFTSLVALCLIAVAFVFLLAALV